MPIEPVAAGLLSLFLCALLVAGSGAVLRLVAVCRHHLERLERLSATEERLRSMDEKRRRREAKIAERLKPKAKTP